MSTAVVFVGGPHPVAGANGVVAPEESAAVESPPDGSLPDRWWPSGTPGPDLVVAVDSGLHLAELSGWAVDRVVGDMDSVDPRLLAAAEHRGAAVERHPVDKDATDLELALDGLLGVGIDSVVVIGSPGGRLDHLMGGLLTVCAARYAPLSLRAWLGPTLVVPVHDHERIEARVGDMVSLIAVHGPAVGVRTEGLRWALSGEQLEPGSSRGLSNEMAAELAEVSVDDGCVAVVVPEEET